MFTIGLKIVSYILAKIVKTKLHEMFTLSMLAITFVIATGSSFFLGTSIALGAFIAGMVIGLTKMRQQVSHNAMPLKDAFSVIFFLSIGMIFNPSAIVDHSWLFLGALGIILVIKPLVAFLITAAFRYPLQVCLTIAVALAQIGEFSFILAEEAMKYKFLPDEGYDIVVGCSLISIAINPLLFKLIK
jgi:monovalent cation:H+ antiporter-2, CPA2 family